MDIGQLIGSLGFPIAIAAYFIVEMNKTLAALLLAIKDLSTEIALLKEAVRTNVGIDT
ncbi:YvrJ family protein [Coprothermobacteraceae bacterium]|nr:YvrJ family protein [Coprothermobacteraceae bacterium]